MKGVDRPLGVALLLVLGLGVVVAGKKSHAARLLDHDRARVLSLGETLEKIEAKRVEVAALRSQVGTESDSRRARAEVAALLLARDEVPALVEHLRAVAQRAVVGTVLPAGAVRAVAAPRDPAKRVARVELQVDLTTEWAQLGLLLAEVRALAPRVVLEEVRVHRAEEVPLLGARLVLAALVTDGGAKLETPARVAAARFAGASPFFLASELAQKKSRRVTIVWTPPPVVLEGVLYAKGSSHVIVNGQPVREGATFTSGKETVKVLDVQPMSARFQIGERVFERELPSLSKGAGR